VGKDLGKSALDEFTFEKSVLMGIWSSWKIYFYIYKNLVDK
jgi:hypothetical protein